MARLACAVGALALALLLGSAGAARAAPAAPPDALVLDAEAVWGYAERLLGQGESFRAISEYKRLLFYFPDSPRAPLARVRVGEAYLRGGEPALAIDALDALLAEPALAPRHDDARYLRGLAWLERDADLPYPLRETSIAAGLADLGAIGADWRGAESVRGFLAAMNDPPLLPRKSPGLAAGLSAVVPGAGSFYVGRYAEGSLAFFLTAVLAYAASTSFQQDHVAAGTVFGVLGLAFYAGGIYAAANGAHKHNDRAKAGYLLAQRQRFGLMLTPGAIGGAFSRTF